MCMPAALAGVCLWLCSCTAGLISVSMHCTSAVQHVYACTHRLSPNRAVIPLCRTACFAAVWHTLAATGRCIRPDMHLHVQAYLLWAVVRLASSSPGQQQLSHARRTPRCASPCRSNMCCSALLACLRIGCLIAAAAAIAHVMWQCGSAQAAAVDGAPPRAAVCAHTSCWPTICHVYHGGRACC